MQDIVVIPACVSVAGVAWSALMEWLRFRGRDSLTDPAFAPVMKNLPLLAIAGEVVAVVAAALVFILV